MKAELKAELEKTDAFRKDWMKTELASNNGNVDDVVKTFAYKGLMVEIVKVGNKFRWKLGARDVGNLMNSEKEAIADAKKSIEDNPDSDLSRFSGGPFVTAFKNVSHKGHEATIGYVMSFQNGKELKQYTWFMEDEGDWASGRFKTDSEAIADFKKTIDKDYE